MDHIIRADARHKVFIEVLSLCLGLVSVNGSLVTRAVAQSGSGNAAIVGSVRM